MIDLKGFTGSAWAMNLRQKNLAGVDPKALSVLRAAQTLLKPGRPISAYDGIDQSTTKAPTAIMESVIRRAKRTPFSG